MSTPCVLPELVRQLDAGKTTITDVVHHFDRQIRLLNPQYRAFISVRDREETVREASWAQELRWRDERPCLGIPIAVKDMMDVVGLPTTGGSIALRRLPNFDATLVTKLKAAGFIIMGKTNMHELGHGITGKNPYFGTVPNPYDMQRLAGGSSSGSAAAVALGMVPVAIGSDTVGSIRIPASYCGIYGFKPGKGVLGMEGCLPLSPTLDHLGLFAGSAGSIRLFFEQLTETITMSTDEVVRIGLPNHFFAHLVTEATMAKFQSFCRFLQKNDKAQVEVVDLPLLAQSAKAGRAIVFREAWDNYQFMLHENHPLGRDVAACLAMGREVSLDEYNAALRFRQELIVNLASVFRHYDFLLLPAVPDSAPGLSTKTILLQGKEVRIAEPLTALNYPASLAGLPALTIPFFAEGDLPIGFQLIAGWGQEARLLRYAESFVQDPTS